MGDNVLYHSLRGLASCNGFPGPSSIPVKLTLGVPSRPPFQGQLPDGRLYGRKPVPHPQENPSCVQVQALGIANPPLWPNSRRWKS
jgi:hypothetical protein